MTTTNTTNGRIFSATLYRLRKGEDPGANASWDVYRTGEGASRQEAARAATSNVPMGYGGHGRSERTLDEIRTGAVVATPLGTYRLEVEELEPELIEGQRGWRIVAGAAGYYAEIGRATYGPCETIEAARGILIAEAGETTPEAIAEELEERPPLSERWAGEIELVTGFVAFARPLVAVGDAVAVTFYPNEDGTPEPTFGFVAHINPDALTASVLDVDGKVRTFAVSTAKTVALIGRRS